jgi:hypothetical protein
LWPFAVTSPWNMPIGPGAQFAGVNDARNAELRSAGAWVNAAFWSHPIYQAQASDPIRLVSGGSGDVTYRIPGGAQAALPNGGDMHVIDPTHHWVDETWDMTPAGDGNWYTPYHLRTDLYGPGVGQGGVRAYTGGVHMGSLFPIPGWVDVNALDLTPQGFMIAHTLQDYGAYLVDAGGNFALFAETAAENMLSGVRNDISTLQNQLQIVTNNSPNAIGGGGTPRVPLAPALR